jgi:hypothetical protein
MLNNISRKPVWGPGLNENLVLVRSPHSSAFFHTTLRTAMIRQIFARMRPALHADFIAVELSDNFQTLSRRLEAMKYVKHHTRRQWFLIGCAMALLGVVAVLPWRVVAQEAKVDAPAEAGAESAIVSSEGASNITIPITSQPVTAAVESSREQQWGNLKGRFLYSGAPPKPAKLKVPKDEKWLERENLVDESLIVAEDGSLANVVIWASTDDILYHPATPNPPKPARAEFVGGRFQPRILSLWTNQPLVIKNFDPVSYSTTFNFNQNLKEKGVSNVTRATSFCTPDPRRWGAPELMPVSVVSKSESSDPHIVKCWFVVQSHPYVAVTDKDGRFEIKNLPAGVPLEFQVWHERAGWIEFGETDGQDVETRKRGRVVVAMPRGRISMNLKPGDNSFGEYTLKPEQFEKQEAKPTFSKSTEDTAEVAIPSLTTNTKFTEEPVSETTFAESEPRPTYAQPAAEHEPAARLGVSNAVVAETRTRVHTTNEESKKIEKQIIGNWRGGLTNAVVNFNADGTFEGPASMLLAQGSNALGEGYTKGNWRVEVDAKQKTGRWLHLEQSFHGGTIRGLPPLPPNPNTAVVTGMRHAMRVLHVDEKFLRLDPGNGSAIFFRRVEKDSDKVKIDPFLSADVRQLAELVSLSPEEATALSADKIDYFQQWKVEKKQIEQLSRLAAAKRGQIDFAELFQLDKNEMEAYAQLYKLTTGNFQTVRSLIEQGQLTEMELRAAKKIDATTMEMFNTLEKVSAAISIAANGETISSPPFSTSVAPLSRATGKLYFELGGLSTYMQGFLFQINLPASPQ